MEVIDGENPPAIGTHVEMVRPCEPAGSFQPGGSFEPAVVVDHLTDPVIGVVLELQFADAWRVQRVWPSPAIRLLT